MNLCECAHYEDMHLPSGCDGEVYDADGEEWNCPCGCFVSETA